MTRQQLIHFITATRGRQFVAMAFVGIFSIAMFRGCQSSPRPETVEVSPPPTFGGLIRSNAVVRSMSGTKEAKTNSAVLPPLRWAWGSTSKATPVSSRLRLPSRRQLPCKLVNTVDSFSPETPVLGLVVENQYFQGELIVPANTEVHARAQSGRFRDRIATQPTWILIFPSGEELSVNALALDRDFDGKTWGPTDGTYGLRGSIQRADDLEAVKLFFAAFLGGFGDLLKDRQSSITGFQVAPTAKNAALSGGGETVDLYARRLMDNLENEGIYVRVPAGKSFYLYTLDPIQPPENLGVSRR